MKSSNCFDENHWITRLGSTLDEVASDSTIFSVGSVTGSALQIYSDIAHRRAYAALAERARADPAADREFQATHMRPNAEPLAANAIIREHPSLQNAFDHAGSNESIEMLLPSKFVPLRLTELVGNLAKAKVKEGGAEAAALLNRYLTWGDDVRLPAHEVILVHGLDVAGPVELGGHAFLASYEDARDRLHLPDDPEPWLDSASRTPLCLDSSSSLCALVRPIAWGPGVIDDRTRLPVDRDPQPAIRHSFPAPCEGIPERYFHDVGVLGVVDDGAARRGRWRGSRRGCARSRRRSGPPDRRREAAGVTPSRGALGRCAPRSARRPAVHPTRGYARRPRRWAGLRSRPAPRSRSRLNPACASPSRAAPTSWSRGAGSRSGRSCHRCGARWPPMSPCRLWRGAEDVGRGVLCRGSASTPGRRRRC